jgi:hypothetical protein
MNCSRTIQHIIAPRSAGVRGLFYSGNLNNMKKLVLVGSGLALVAASAVMAQDTGTGPDVAALSTSLTNAIDGGITVGLKAAGACVGFIGLGWLIFFSKLGRRK